MHKNINSGLTVSVTEDLNFNVTRSCNILLDEHDVVAERLDRLPLRGLQLGLELGLGHADSHSLAAASSHGLDHDGVADGSGLSFEPLE